MRDIKTTEDIKQLLEKFYSTLLLMDGFKQIFSKVDMAEHMPHIVHFWSFVLLDAEGYKTNVFEKHLKHPIQTEQFDKWLTVFTSTVDELFKGEKAELAKLRATSLAFTFKSKWKAIKE